MRAWPAITLRTPNLRLMFESPSPRISLTNEGNRRDPKKCRIKGEYIFSPAPTLFFGLLHNVGKHARLGGGAKGISPDFHFPSVPTNVVRASRAIDGRRFGRDRGR